MIPLLGRLAFKLILILDWDWGLSFETGSFGSCSAL